MPASKLGSADPDESPYPLLPPVGVGIKLICGCIGMGGPTCGVFLDLIPNLAGVELLSVLATN